MWEWILIIVIVIALLIIALFFSYYNRIITLSNRIDNAWAQIDVQLKKRADLVPNLVETVKGYMAHEKRAIEMVTTQCSLTIMRLLHSPEDGLLQG